MRAADLMEPYPTIELTAPAGEAGRLLGREGRPAVIVVDRGRPVGVLPASALVRVLVPGYLQEDPSLVRVYDERAADACAQRLDGKLVKDVLPPRERRADLPVVDTGATLLECAALIARLRVPLLAVTAEHGGALVGAITAARILETMVP